MLSSIGAAMSGIANATNRFDRASAKIAQPADDTVIGDEVDQITAAHDVKANLATIRTADDMVGTLINTIA
jgi:hypothetical protein